MRRGPVGAVARGSGIVVLAVWMAVAAVAQGDRVAALIASLSSEDPGARLVAARELGQLAVWEAAEPLVLLLADADEEVREAAIGALEQIDEGAVDAALEGMKSEVPGVRAGCADVLGRLVVADDRRIGEALLVAVGDPEPAVRFRALGALGEIGDPVAAEAMKQALEDEDVQVRVQAAASLTRIGDGSGLPVLLKAVNHSEPDMRILAVGGLARIAAPAAIQAIRDLTTDDDPTVRRVAYTSLISIGTPDTIEAGLAGLKDPSRNVRADVAHLLGTFRPPGVADALLETLQSDESGTVRVTAGMALAHIGDKRAEPILLERLGSDYRDLERAGAAHALGVLATREAIKPLTELIDDEDSRVRRAAKMALIAILEECPDCQ